MEAGRTTARKIPVRKAVGHGNGRGRPKTYGRNAGRRARRQFVQFMICGAAFVALVAAKLWTPEHAVTLRRTLGAAMERNMDVQEIFSTVGRTFAGEQDPEHGLRAVWRAVFLPETAPDTPESSESVAQSDAPETSGNVAESETAQGVTESVAQASAEIPATESVTASEDAQTPESVAETETLTPYHWEGTFGNNTAFTSLSEPWPETSVSVAANVAESPSDGNAFDDTHPEGQASVLYGGRKLPENVGMQQVLLNFDYQCPVKGTLTSAFGYRNHPIDGAERFHYGVDIAAETGTEIVCFADGVVTATGESTSFGKYCTVEHGGGFTTLYAHCSKITASSGAAVRMGDKIAEVGATGQATGPHLHFALQREGIYLNPIYYVTD